MTHCYILESEGSQPRKLVCLDGRGVMHTFRLGDGSGHLGAFTFSGRLASTSSKADGPSSLLSFDHERSTPLLPHPSYTSNFNIYLGPESVYMLLARSLVLLVFGHWDTCVRVYDVGGGDGRCIQCFPGHKDGVTCW